MKKIEAIELDDNDVKDPDNVMTSLTDDAFKACISATVVIYRGKVVKNRLGNT